MLYRQNAQIDDEQRREPNPDDPRVKRTRKLILDAFLELTREKHFDAMTIGEISDRATVNRTTFYTHFRDKFDLFEHAIKELLGARFAVDDSSETLSRGDVVNLCLGVFDFVEEACGHCRPDNTEPERLFQPAMHATLYERLSRALKEAEALVASYAIVGAAFQWNRAGRPKPAKPYASRIVDVLMDGIERPPRKRS